MNIEFKKAIDLVKSAGEEVLNIYEKTPRIFEKKDKSPVTDADLASEKVIMSGLKKSNIPVLSEESKDDRVRLEKERVWILDPLDGTLDFLQRTGEFSIMLGLVENERPVFGVVYAPSLGKLYFAEKGKKAYLEEKGTTKKLSVSGVGSLKESTFVMSRNHLSNKEKEFIKTKKIKEASFIGSVGVKLGLIAEGRAEGYMNISNKTFEWDICASDIILHEAGGKVTDLNEKEFKYNRTNTRNERGILATNGKIHSLVAAEIGEIL